MNHEQFMGYTFYGLVFLFQRVTFVGDEAIGSGINMAGPDGFSGEPEQVGQAGDRPGHHIIVLAAQVFDPDMTGRHVFQSQMLYRSLHHFYFFPGTVYQVEADLGPEDGQRNAWKTTPGAQVEDFCARRKIHKTAQREAMEDMVQHELLHIFSGDQVYFFIPFPVKGFQGVKPGFLDLRKIGEVLFDKCRHAGGKLHILG